MRRGGREPVGTRRDGCELRDGAAHLLRAGAGDAGFDRVRDTRNPGGRQAGEDVADGEDGDEQGEPGHADQGQCADGHQDQGNAALPPAVAAGARFSRIFCERQLLISAV